MGPVSVCFLATHPQPLSAEQRGELVLKRCINHGRVCKMLVSKLSNSTPTGCLLQEYFANIRTLFSPTFPSILRLRLLPVRHFRLRMFLCTLPVPRVSLASHAVHVQSATPGARMWFIPDGICVGCSAKLCGGLRATLREKGVNR
jgi:hypothetical protein